MDTPLGGDLRRYLQAPPDVPTRGPAALGSLRPFDPRSLSPDHPASLWRYRESFPADTLPPAISLGEGWVPLESHTLGGVSSPCWLLRDDLEPTGSSKDRGTSLLASELAAAGHRRVVDDSMGNAALSLAGYCKAAGLQLVSYMPSSSLDARKVLVRRAGARVIEVPGTAADATREAGNAARRGALWIRRNQLAFDGLGGATAAFNIVERLGRMPGVVITPVGHGHLLAGLYRGFESMAAAGVGSMPLLIGVQSSACCPIARRWSEGPQKSSSVPSPPASTFTDSVSVPAPARGDEAIDAAGRSGGGILAVDDLALERAVRSLWLAGIGVEPSAALGLALLMDESVQRTLSGAGEIVLVLTGHGMRDGLSLCPGL